MLLDVNTVYSNDSHGMGVELDESGSKGCHADDVDFVSLNSIEIEGYILRVIDQLGVREGREKDGI